MAHLKLEFFKILEEKLNEKILSRYGITAHDAINNDQKTKAICKALMDVFYEFHDSEEGQNWLFNGGNSLSMIYKTVAREDHIYRYIGRDPLNPYTIFPGNFIESIEKDAEVCEESGCASGGRPLWCVNEYEIERHRVSELCNFCASQLNQAEIDKCLSNSEECKSCGNRQLAIDLNGDQGLQREKKVIPIK